MDSPLKEYNKSGNLISFPEYSFTYANNISTMKSNVEKIPYKIRADKISDHIDLSESFCSDKVTSKFCLSIASIRAIADEVSLNPVFSSTTGTFKVQVGTKQSCNRIGMWPFRKTVCRDIAVMGYVHRYMGEFAEANIQL